MFTDMMQYEVGNAAYEIFLSKTSNLKRNNMGTLQD